MSSNYKVKQITRLYDSCNNCGLPTINCICNKTIQIETKAKIWILSTEKEFRRPSNTARVLKLINSNSTDIFLWERINEPLKLIEKINSDIYEVFLLFPVEDDELKSREVKYEGTGKVPAFIIIDGTWKEAKKIMRKSSYLKELPIVSLTPSYKTEYDLRRGAESGNLCTIEAAIEALKLNGETNNTLKIKEFYNLFLKSFKASIKGHKLKK